MMMLWEMHEEAVDEASGVGYGGWGLAAAAVGAKAHGFYRGGFGMMPSGRPPAPMGPGRANTLGGVLWLWTKKLLAVSFMASMIAIGQYFYTHFTKKWESENLPSMPIGVLRGAIDAKVGGSGGSGGLLGGPSTNTSATASVRPGRQMNYEEYKD